jgi:hypothetical protein
LGSSLITGIITALWEKLRHGSLDWYAIGGMFVATFVVFLSVFRKQRGNVGLKTQAAQTAQALEIGIPTLSALLGQNLPITFDPKAYFAQAYYSPITAEVEKNFKIIAQRYEPNDKAGFNARFIGVGLVAYQHDVTVNAGERVIRFSRSWPEPVIQREPRSTGTR